MYIDNGGRKPAVIERRAVAAATAAVRGERDRRRNMLTES